MSEVKFNPLTLINVLAGDPDITSSSLLGLLVTAVRHMDNKTGRVKASEELLAKDARLSPDTVQRLFGKDGNRVTRYFTVTGKHRSLSFTFKPIEVIQAAIEEARASTESPHGAGNETTDESPHPAAESPHPAPESPHGAPESPHGAAPSASTSASSSANSSALVGRRDLHSVQVTPPSPAGPGERGDEEEDPSGEEHQVLKDGDDEKREGGAVGLFRSVWPRGRRRRVEPPVPEFDPPRVSAPDRDHDPPDRTRRRSFADIEADVGKVQRAWQAAQDKDGGEERP